MGLIEIILVLLVVPYMLAGFVVLYFNNRYNLEKFLEKSNQNPSISIVLPTYNEEEIIGDKLENIIEFIEYPNDKLEIVVVDSSEDRTPQIVKEYRGKYPFIRLIREEERRGLAVALNKGYEAASGDIVIKSDVDSKVLTEDALQRISSFFSDEEVGGVCGIRIGKEDVEGGFRSLQVLQQKAESVIDSTIIAHGSFSAFRKDLIEPIREDSFADDTEIFVKIRKKGFRTLLDTGIETFEPYEKHSRKRIRQMGRRAGGIIKVLFENIRVLFNPSYGKFGTVVYPLNILTLVLLPWAVLTGWVTITYLLESQIGIFSYLASISLGFFGLAAYYFEKPRSVSGFLDTLISSLYGQLKLLIGAKEHKWEKSRPEEKSED